MSQLFNYSGDEEFFARGSMYSNPKEAEYFMSLRNQIDAFFPCKRARIDVPLLRFDQIFVEQKQTSLDALPDELLFEIFCRLPGGQERSMCAGVSKRWLALLSSIKASERKNGESDSEDTETEDGLLTRCLEGKKATDLRLAAIAVGTSSRGGLGKLIIKGDRTGCRVSSHGFRAISRCCPALKVLSLWNVPSIGDEALIEIANGCNQLEKLDLTLCPSVTDKALVAIAKGCPNLNSLAIDSCQNIGNEGLQAIGKLCPNLTSVSIKSCPRVGDQGISSLLSSLSNVITKVKLQGLNVSDVTLAVVGHYGREVTDLVLSGLQNVGERGFWCMGNGQGLQKLKTLTIISCRGVTDLGIESVGKGCPSLKTFCLHKCAFLSDNGLVSFAKSAGSLETVQLDECHRITQVGFFELLLNCGTNFKAFAVSNCFGIKDMPHGVTLPESASSSLKSLAVRNCPLFGDMNLVLLSRICTHLQFLDLSGLAGISDYGVTPLIESSDDGLIKVKLGRCINLTDNTVSALIKTHGGTLELLNLGGCMKITDASLVTIAEDCFLLNDLDVSRCAITDFGISVLSQSNQLVSLQILSVSGCTLLSDRSLPFFAILGRSLVGLNLQLCNNISSRTTDMLEERLWNCDILP